MINIAICDDSVEICNQLENILEQLSSEFKVQMKIESFYNENKFIKRIQNVKDFDLVFLDIELNNILGSQVGSYIRDELKWEKLSIIYISNKSDYALSLFKTRPHDFIVKPLTYENIKTTTSKYLELYKRNSKVFKYKIGSSFYKINIEDILYFESSDKLIIIHCIDRCVSFSGKLKDIYEVVLKLGTDFLLIHHSYLVNYDYVVEVNYDNVKMSNDEVLPISQSKRSEIRKIQLERWGNKKDDK